MAQSGSGNPVITAALAQMAAFRQASGVDDDMLDLFSARLTADGHRLEDVVAACRHLEHQARAEGETAFPELGRLQGEIHAQARRRRMRERAERLLPAAMDEPTYRCWQCQDDPAGWIELACLETPCERTTPHQPHVYAVRCPHWLREKREALQESAQKALQRGARPSAVCVSLQEVDANAYRYQRAVTIRGREASKGHRAA